MMAAPQYSLKIPQRPYDGDTFALALVPKDGDYCGGTELSYVLNNSQPEDCKTKIFYAGKLWEPNDIIPLVTNGYSHSVIAPSKRIEQKTITTTVREAYEDIEYQTVIVQREVDEEYQEEVTEIVHHPAQEIVNVREKKLRIYLMMDDSLSMSSYNRIDGLNAGIQAFWSSMTSNFGQNLDCIYLSMYLMGAKEGWRWRNIKMSTVSCPVFTPRSGAGLQNGIDALHAAILADLNDSQYYLSPIAVLITDATDPVAESSFVAWDNDIKPVCQKVLASGIDMEYPEYITRLASTWDDALFQMGAFSPGYQTFFNKITDAAVGSFNETIIIPAWDEEVTRTVTKTRKVMKDFEETIEVPVTKYRDVEKQETIDVVVYDPVGTEKTVCHVRTIQYFTYIKIIDTWICYWQHNICDNVTPVMSTITVYVLAGDSQIKLLPKSPITENNNHGFDIIGKLTYTASIGSRFNRITYGDLIDAVGYQGEKNSESIKDIVQGKKNYTYTGRGATFLCATNLIGFNDFADRGMKIFGGVNGVTKYIPGLSLSGTTHDFRVNRWEINIGPGGREPELIIDRYSLSLGLEGLEEFIDTPIGTDFIVEGDTVINLLFCHEEMLGYVPPFYTDTGEVNENPRLPGGEGNPYYGYGGYYGYPTP